MFTRRSWALLGSVAVVVAAVLTFLITGSPDADPAVASAPSQPGAGAAPDERQRTDKPDAEPAEPAEPRRKPPTKPTAYVEVFNNSGVTGLASETASQLSGAGWQVVATDNWYGDIPATTVYHPTRLRGQAVLLADEIGAARLRPAVEPMRFDRLTLILTGDL